MKYCIKISKKELLSNMIAWCLALNFGFYPILSKVFSPPLDSGFLLIAFLLAILSLLVSGFPYMKCMLPWILVWGLITINCIHFDSTFASSRDLFIYLVCMYSLAKKEAWMEQIIKVLCTVCMLHVAATIVFFIFPFFYRATMPKFWGFYPIGTENGWKGYRAALSPHYSTNGIYCAIAFLISGGRYLIGRNTKIVKKRLFKVMLLSFATVLLTTKRAHLLFSVLSLMAGYYLCKQEKSSKKLLKLLRGGILLTILLTISVHAFPVLEETVNRFFKSGDISTGRFAMWALAWQLFLQNPIIGIGWGKYATVMYRPLGIRSDYATSVHNVYLQVLCETGIIGFSFFVIVFFVTYYATIKTIRTCELDHKYYNMLLISALIQTFVLLYNFTGNCIYDFTLCVYMISVMISITIRKRALKADLKFDNEVE